MLVGHILSPSAIFLPPRAFHLLAHFLKGSPVMFFSECASSNFSKQHWIPEVLTAQFSHRLQLTLESTSHARIKFLSSWYPYVLRNVHSRNLIDLLMNKQW